MRHEQQQPMTAKRKSPVIYYLESGATERGGELNWSPVVDRHQQPITFQGRGSKAKAVKCAAELSKHDVYEAIRVMRGSEVVWFWKEENVR
jgi:hypothetical protein